MSSRRLSPVQVQVLGRLVAGESISRADSDLRVTVYALRNRGLVVTLNRPGKSGESGVSRVPRGRDSLDSHATVMMRLRSNSTGVSQPSWL